jgi:hypothetical protein
VKRVAEPREGPSPPATERLHDSLRPA